MRQLVHCMSLAAVQTLLWDVRTIGRPMDASMRNACSLRKIGGGSTRKAAKAGSGPDALSLP